MSSFLVAAALVSGVEENVGLRVEHLVPGAASQPVVVAVDPRVWTERERERTNIRVNNISIRHIFMSNA